MVYNRGLHPELFDMKARRSHRQNSYETEAWVAASGHTVRFQIDGQCITETVIDHPDHLPENGLVHAMPCLGEKEFELTPTGEIGYVTTIQTEALTDNLYMATYREMCEFAVEHGSLEYRWTDEEGAACLSLLDSQTYKWEFHIQTYHLLGRSCIVLRTQSIFECLRES